MQLKVVIGLVASGNSRLMPIDRQKSAKIEIAEQNEGLVMIQKSNGKLVERLDAWPVKFIHDRRSQEVIGWVYEWNTGEQEPMWKNGRREDLIYEHCCDDPGMDGR